MIRNNSTMYHNLLQNEANWTGRIYEYLQIEKGSFVVLRIPIQYRTGSETMDRNFSAELISICIWQEAEPAGLNRKSLFFVTFVIKKFYFYLQNSEFKEFISEGWDWGAILCRLRLWDSQHLEPALAPSWQLSIFKKQRHLQYVHVALKIYTKVHFHFSFRYFK